MGSRLVINVCGETDLKERRTISWMREAGFLLDWGTAQHVAVEEKSAVGEGT